ncbi:MAG: four helix bundle protein [Bacteroidales bacterium]|nr:four helix bundle protein [Bacteroidales bacterium]MBN2762733.1 four helix bundle protein [Bacteroidales bacterium]
MNKIELENRLIAFAVEIMNISEKITNNKSGGYLNGQLVRSGNSSALNYGEAQSAESTGDFVHKLKVILKELRETYINLKITKQAKLCENDAELDKLIKEHCGLNAIFVKSIDAATNKKGKR